MFDEKSNVQADGSIMRGDAKYADKKYKDLRRYTARDSKIGLCCVGI